jgi:cytochrome P450
MTVATDRVEIDFSIYNPFSMEFARDPFPAFDRLLTEFPVAYHRDINLWLVSPHDLALEVLRSPRFSTRFEDWNNAPPTKPREEWDLYDLQRSASMASVSSRDHQRLRKLTAPAFSRRVMDQIEDKIRDSISQVFDEIADPREFDVASELAEKIPIRAIAKMVGLPPDADELFEQSLGYHMVRASSPMHAAQRDEHIAATLPGLQYVLDAIAERRAAAHHGDDFIGTLVDTRIDGEQLSDLEILSVITSLVVAGADTAVDLHTLAIDALLRHPDQWALLRERPELMEPAILEILRWSGHGKFGGIPRFPLEDIELGGQVLDKGSFVMPMFSTAWLDPAKWPEPRRFDITRNHAGNIVFGAGPHLCIGLNLVKVQGKLLIEEFDRRFGATAELTGEVEFDPNHFNARRMTKLMVRTG